MISVNKVSVYFGGTALFKDISFRINKGDRIGLVGRNGAGKSTMLKVLSKDLEIDEGALSYDGEVRVGILRQDLEFNQDRTLMEEVESAFVELKKVESRLEVVNNQLAERTDYESEQYMKLIEESNTLNDRFDMLGGFTFRADIERVLIGLGFKAEDFNKLCSQFSGGWRMRIELARLLLQRNEVMLLDEPTNHLDIESIIWLENFLKSYPGAVVLVSHDKTFLNNVTNRTIEISLGRVYDYKQPYSKYLELRKEQREQMMAAQKNQEKEIKQKEELIERFRYKASKAAFAQNLIKQLDRMDRIEVESEDVATMNVRFTVAQQPGKIITEAEHAGKSFGEHKVFSDANFIVERGEKIAFVGQNGQGKTTMVRMMLGELLYDGKITMGHNVKVGYFAQNQAELLDGNKTLLQTVEDEANEETRKKARDLLGAFLFSGEDVDKKVKVLSGGERGRLAMCCMLVQPFNVLIMDEPTNHLDIQSKNVLKQALNNFGGTLIVVSHDRDFLDGLVEKVYEFREGRVKEFLGGVNYYLEEREMANFREVEMRNKLKKEESAPSEQALSYAEKKQLDKDIRKASNQLSKVERQISDLESSIEDFDEQLASDTEGKLASDPDFFAMYEESKKDLEEAMERWEEIEETLEVLKAKRV